jgi:hypothetical protein
MKWMEICKATLFVVAAFLVFHTVTWACSPSVGLLGNSGSAELFGNGHSIEQEGSVQ